MAPLADALENLGLLGLSVLAVVGAAVAGGLLTALLVWLVCRLFFRRQPPPLARKLLRWLGAIAGALLVAGYLHFNDSYIKEYDDYYLTGKKACPGIDTGPIWRR